MYYLYILSCTDASLYTGITTNVARRFEEHKKGIGAKYTRSHPVIDIVYTEACVDRSSALKREYEVKRMTKPEKLNLIKQKGTFGDMN